MLLLFCFTACVGDGDLEISELSMPKLVFSTTHNHNLVINKAGELYAWGFNGSGRLGDGTNAKRNRPIRIDTSTNNANWKNIAAGGYHSLAINKDDELYAWGLNDRGQLGNGGDANAHKTTPVKIKNLVSEF